MGFVICGLVLTGRILLVCFRRVFLVAFVRALRILRSRTNRTSRITLLNLVLMVASAPPPVLTSPLNNCRLLLVRSHDGFVKHRDVHKNRKSGQDI